MNAKIEVFEHERTETSLVVGCPVGYPPRRTHRRFIMVRIMSTHLWITDGRSACGKPIPDEYLTENEIEVTCGSCSRGWDVVNRRSWANKKARESPGYADNTFSGTGVLSCYLCGNPIRDHKSWPCSLRVDI